MSAFIARMIEQNAKISMEQGQQKYRAYFVNTSLYLNWKAEVDTILRTDGFNDVIVEQ
ncbi:hypothetical protein ACFO0S_09570 [Chryseomicrobium palamuruense]|uniref:Uncharacterized protein n=1 Tax=Chryseomicrobium palamuruense TaxID=682973 RepID=A0ABV8UXQ4_9BACL